MSSDRAAATGTGIGPVLVRRRRLQGLLRTDQGRGGSKRDPRPRPARDLAERDAPQRPGGVRAKVA